MHTTLIAERAEMVRRSDLARGFACMATDHTTRSLMKAKARQYGQAALALSDAIDGPLPPDIAAMDDNALMLELGTPVVDRRRFEVFHLDGGEPAAFVGDEATAIRFRDDLNRIAAKEGDTRAPFDIWDTHTQTLVVEG